MRELTAPIELPNEPAEPLTIWEKLSLVARQCSYIQKDGENQFHRYHYATAAAVYEKVNQALSDSGLVSVPEMEVHSLDLRTNAKGATETLATLKVTLSIIDTETGEKVSTTAFGSGMDNGDKAIMKAQTAAMKYAWMDLLNISTGDDPEADHAVDTRVTGEKMPKAPARGPKTGDFTAADKELARQAAVQAVEKCDLCGNPLKEYKSGQGKVYRQCQWAHEEWEKTRRTMPGISPEALKAVSKGHTYKAGPQVTKKIEEAAAETGNLPPVGPTPAAAPPVKGGEDAVGHEQVLVGAPKVAPTAAQHAARSSASIAAQVDTLNLTPQEKIERIAELSKQFNEAAGL